MISSLKLTYYFLWFKLFQSVSMNTLKKIETKIETQHSSLVTIFPHYFEKGQIVKRKEEKKKTIMKPGNMGTFWYQNFVCLHYVVSI